MALAMGGLAHAGLARNEDIGFGVGRILHQGPMSLHGAAFEDQAGGGGPGAQLGNFLRVLLNGVPQITVIALHGADLLHGDGIKAHGVLERSAVVKKRNADGGHVFVNVIDGLRGGDLFLAADDLSSNAGGERSVSLQIKSGPADNGVGSKSKIAFVGFADPEDGAACIGEHHFVCQYQIVLRTNDFEKLLERKFGVRKVK